MASAACRGEEWIVAGLGEMPAFPQEGHVRTMGAWVPEPGSRRMRGYLAKALGVGYALGMARRVRWGDDGEKFVGGEDGGGESASVVWGEEEAFGGKAEVELGGEEAAVDFVGVGDERVTLDFGVLLAELGVEVGRRWEPVVRLALRREVCAAEAAGSARGAVGFGFRMEKRRVA